MTEYINGKRVIEGYTEGARVYNSGALTIATATPTDLTFDSERRDTDNIHDTGSNTNRLTCKTAGDYLIIANLDWEYNVTNRRFVRIKLDGTTDIASVEQDPGSVGYCGQHVSCEYYLAVNQYVTMNVYQNSGGNLDVNAIGNMSPIFSMRRIG